MAAYDRTATVTAASPDPAASAPAPASNRDPLGKWLVAGAVSNGAVAATYIVFSVYVMPMLGDKDDADFVDSMQRINAGIENPVFFLAFLGAMAAPAVAWWKLRKRGGDRTLLTWTAAAFLLYTAGVLTTSGINVPLNGMLASKGDANPSGVRADFETTWNVWNGVRAVLSTAAFVCAAKAVRLHRRAVAYPRGDR
ncbi:DUF1772 domain-containing protein [Yinghuangia sp. YIM S09857]|uniref:anthrone oxygenase family protein n=1 Tax=Yinghuangia sp. YIM S09857 TaxID=3436929 RepID=UPI003F53E3DA